MRSTPSALARLFGVAVALLAIVAVPQHAQAHTDFDYSVPTDGAAVGTPLTEVAVAFTFPVTLVGSGFEVLDPLGNLLQPFAVTDDDTVFRLQFDPPLAGGEFSVRYTVAAEDGHALSGSFSFTISVALPTSTVVLAVPTSPASVPVTTLPATLPSLATATTVTSPDSDAVIDDATTSTSGPGDEQSNSGLAIGIAAGVAALAALFLAVQARSGRAS